ncbi:MAG: DegT/DnrJ/EryC1/StrS family aminotransferase [Terriglobales bacterium]
MGVQSIAKLPEVQLVDLQAQYRAIAPQVNDAIVQVLEDADFILGKAVTKFEEQFAAYCGVRFAVGVDSGMSALELALRAHGIGPGDEVITAANTFIATALAISHCGATPVLVDVNPRTYTLDPEAVAAAISPRTAAIIPVHLYGQTAEMDAVAAIATRHNLLVVEDACQAHGARYKGRRAGCLGDAAAFSFYPGKNLGACGDGGMITTNDAAIQDRLRKLRNYGQAEKYHHVVRGYNRRLDSMQAAVLLAKLAHLDAWNALRARNSEAYTRLLADTGVVTPFEPEWSSSVWHLYVIQSDERDQLKGYLEHRGIRPGIHYPIPIHLQPAYAELGYRRGDFPIAERLALRILSLPMFAELTDEQLQYVADSICAYCGQRRDEAVAA